MLQTCRAYVKNRLYTGNFKLQDFCSTSFYFDSGNSLAETFPSEY